MRVLVQNANASRRACMAFIDAHEKGGVHTGTCYWTIKDCLEMSGAYLVGIDRWW